MTALPAPSAWWPYQPAILAQQPEYMLSVKPLPNLPHTGSVLTLILTMKFTRAAPQGAVQPAPSPSPHPHLDLGSK